MSDPIKNSEQITTVDTNLLLIEIASILYQVNSIDIAQEMIFDTLSEQFGIKKMAITVFNEMDEEYQVTHQFGLSTDFESQFRISNLRQLNDSVIATDEATYVSCPGGEVKLGDRKLNIGSDIEDLVFFPINFHERTVGLLLLGQKIPTEDGTVVLRFSNLLGPVISSIEPARKPSNRFENIISKIIKDRVHEARLVLNPISFSIFRFVVGERLMDSMVLEDMVRSYQTVFHNTLVAKGDLIWLTADTVLFVFPNADLFESEQLVSELKDSLGQFCKQHDAVPNFSLKHAAISYPQSGDDVTEIVNNLWLKLFEEIYLME